MLRAHEEELKEAQAVPATLPELEATKAALKVGRGRASREGAGAGVGCALGGQRRAPRG